MMKMTDEAKEKSMKTRLQNQEARLALCQERAAATRAARLALTKILECQDATPEQILRAAELLAELGKY